MQYAAEHDETLYRLRERVKELTALHKTARLLQDDGRPESEVLADVVELLPRAWQYPEIAAARVVFGPHDVSSRDFRATKWMQREQIRSRSGEQSWIEIAYLEERPDADEGPFLSEERDLIRSLAEMLRAYFQHRLSAAEIRTAHDSLERQVAERTQDLRRLAAELSLAEARKDRELATDLHDNLIQEFAFMKLRIMQFRGDAVFCGFEQRFDEIIALIERAIRFTRKVTFEISSPILYEIGLKAALESLAEQTAERHGIRVTVHGELSMEPTEAVKVTLFRCVQELMANACKHAGARSLAISLATNEHDEQISVRDDGVGFNAEVVVAGASSSGFGLFSIRERLRYFGGSMTIDSAIGLGTTVHLRLPRELP